MDLTTHDCILSPLNTQRMVPQNLIKTSLHAGTKEEHQVPKLSINSLKSCDSFVCMYKYNARANQETAVIIHGYYLLDLKPENLVTWTSCLIPLAATRPGSCLMVA